MSPPLKVLVVLGTRPEGIKLAPVIRRLTLLAEEGEVARPVICVTGQHRAMLDQVLELFEIAPDHDLDVMRHDQTPTEVASAVLAALPPVLAAERPDWILVQGDTISAAAAALAGFLARVRVGHVEAGLRTHDKWQPFPEEVNRRIAGVVADLHFTPTPLARENLAREGIASETILMTGNTVIDALQTIAARPLAETSPGGVDFAALDDAGRRVLLVTAHRRESFGRPFEEICLALRDLAEAYPDEVTIVYAVHRNPNVWDPAHRLLGAQPNVQLVPPLDYLTLVNLMKRARLILTDSGSIQEEAPSLGVPVLVLRELTERPEAVAAGAVRVVGTERSHIVETASRLLDDADEHDRMSKTINPYGDGHASERIVAALLGRPFDPFDPTRADHLPA